MSDTTDIYKSVLAFNYIMGAGDFPEYLVRDTVNWLGHLPRCAGTVSISGCGQHDMDASLVLDLRDVEGVEVLHIVDNPGLRELWLSRVTCAHIRSLIVRVPVGTSLIVWTCDQEWSGNYSAESTGREGLRWVNIEGDVCFRSSQLSERRYSPGSRLSNAFFTLLQKLHITSLAARHAADLVSILGGLKNLEALFLSHMRGVRSIDVTTCANLKRLFLQSLPQLELISGFENSNLEDVRIHQCDKVSVLTIPADSKACFRIDLCNSLERVSFVGGKSSTYGAGEGCFFNITSIRVCCKIVMSRQVCSRAFADDEVHHILLILVGRVRTAASL